MLETEALRPRASPGPAVLRMRIFPSLDVVDRLTFPEHRMKMPRAACPSTKRIAPAGTIFSDSPRLMRRERVEKMHKSLPLSQVGNRRSSRRSRFHTAFSFPPSHPATSRAFLRQEWAPRKRQSRQDGVNSRAAPAHAHGFRCENSVRLRSAPTGLFLGLPLEPAHKKV